jgi:hypothetical protein
MNFPLSPMAQALLRGHLANVPAYLTYEALGGTIHESDLKKIDDAYEELVRSGFMQKTAATVAVLPKVTRNQFLLTMNGNNFRKTMR